MFYNYINRQKYYIRKYSTDGIQNVLKNLSEMVNLEQNKYLLPTRKFVNNGPSTAYLQVLGTGARGAPSSLYLFTERGCYLFNCGECVQRLAREHKVKISKLNHIFITSKTWSNAGGLLGLTLTLQNFGVKNVSLHAPEGLDEVYNAASKFVKMKKINVDMVKCVAGETFEDDVVAIKYVHLGQDAELQTKQLPISFIVNDVPFGEDYKKLTSEASDGDCIKKNKKEEFGSKSPRSIAYICTVKERRRRSLEPSRRMQPAGDQDAVPRETLQEHSVDGLLDDPKCIFIVLEVVEISCLRESEFAAHFDAADNPPEQVPALVVHFTPPHVFHHPRYREFMSKFGLITKHLVLNSENSCLGSEAVHRIQCKHRLLDAETFPLLRDVSVPAVWPLRGANVLKQVEQIKHEVVFAQFQNMKSGADGDEEERWRIEAESRLGVIAARTLTVYHLRPKRQLDRSREPKLQIPEYIAEMMDVEGFENNLEKFHQLVVESRNNKTSGQSYPRIVFLGTGSGIPNKVRNCSGILLRVDEKRSLLLDCGEGTFGQLVRFFGPENVNSFLRTLKAVYVSHLHSDHHLGLMGVLRARRQAFAEVSQHVPALHLLAPQQLFWWLYTYSRQFDDMWDSFVLVPNQNLMDENPHRELSAAIMSEMGLQGVATCRVPHTPTSFGVALRLDQHKITYSGDTLPCDELIRIGQNSTLLIHEATFGDERAQEARKKLHATTSQAVDVGRRMRARHTILTHFSHRYRGVPQLDPQLLRDYPNVGVAFDNMQLSMRDLDLLPHVYSLLQQYESALQKRRRYHHNEKVRKK